jgi:hypothetical protein
MKSGGGQSAEKHRPLISLLTPPRRGEKTLNFDLSSLIFRLNLSP